MRWLSVIENRLSCIGVLITLFGFALSGCTAEPPPPHPRMLESANFTIVTESQFDAKAILIDLEQLRVAALQDWGIVNPPDETQPISLTFIKDEAIYFGIAPLSHAAGYYTDTLIGDNIVIFDQDIFSASDAGLSGQDRLQAITRHEAIHALLRRHVPAALPLWAAEGLAEFYTNYERSDDGTVRFGALLNVGDPDRWPPMDVTLSTYTRYPEFAQPDDPDNAQFADNTKQFYGVSHGLAHLLLENVNGIHTVHDWHRVISDGWSLQDASTGLLSPANANVWEHLRQKIEANEPTLRVADNVPLVQISAIDHVNLSEAEYAAHLRRLVRMHHPLSGDDRAPVFGRLMQAHSDAANYALAQAFEAYNSGQYDAAQSHLARSLTRDPNDPAALLLQSVAALADFERFGRNTDDLNRAWQSFRAAESAAKDPTLVYAFRVNLLNNTPYAINSSEDMNHYLDVLRNQNVHSRYPNIAHILIEPYLKAGREEYARRLFFSTFHHTPSPYVRNEIWRLYSRRLGLDMDDLKWASGEESVQSP
jgi:tetratricopeptide (TPR) repeat protein